MSGLSTFPTIVLSVFSGSTLLRQLWVIEKYDMDIKVCTPMLIQLSSQWATERIVRGSLQHYVSRM